MIRLHSVCLRHDKQVAVDSLSGEFLPGSLTAVIGPNGAGKTTLIRAVAGLHRVAAGSIDRGGLSADQIAYVSQAPVLDRDFPIGCLDLIALAMASRRGWLRALSRAHWLAASAALDRVGLGSLARRPVGSLSAGQFQRLMFARAIAQDAPILLLDEPFNSVDEPTAADLLAILLGWHAEGRTVVVAVHDLELVRRTFPDTLLLSGHAVAWGRTGEVLTPESLLGARLGMSGWVDRVATAIHEPA